ncbi:CDK5RAP1-like protein [Pseudolycoriella hygida]|uniref:CDK5RAP1-like protein n=1 Tax=Pseudolycoriella hygida TaxID=35572 RepID=A0A9Q0N8S8_9DIPT|nr:CDK5RAP1-like protein [Pseudolycoriella hygida]
MKLPSRIQLSPHIYLTVFKLTNNNTTMMATSFPNISRLLSFNLNFRRNLSILGPLCSTRKKKLQTDITSGPGLKEFLVAGKNIPKIELDNSIPYLKSSQFNGNGRRVFFEIYGCQMNSNDAEVVYSVLKSSGYTKADRIEEADVVLLVTCSIRDRAETKIWHRLDHLTAIKRKRSSKKGPFQIGILGCMAERLKTKLLEKEQLVDIVAGPDSYKDLPRLLSLTKNGQSAVNTLLSLDETYADVMPVRLNEGSVTAYVTIMRGCDNMCSYCIVPFTRGRERSRPISSIENEVKVLAEQGIKEITLLGQNVNSYCDLTSDPDRTKNSPIVTGFKTVYKPKVGGVRFAELLETVAKAAPKTRIRFTSPHPKDFPNETLQVIKNHPNVCKSIHLPAQSGNNGVLERMRRGYTREAYMELVNNIRQTLPEVSLSSDFICGFCGETDEEFADTLSLMETVKYNVAYLFAYSMREKTTAHRRYSDDVPDEVKLMRLQAMVQIYRDGAAERNAMFVGKHQQILIEGVSKKSPKDLYGRNDANIKIIIPSTEIPTCPDDVSTRKGIKPGDLVMVNVTESNSQVLKGEALYHCEELI